MVKFYYLSYSFLIILIFSYPFNAHSYYIMLAHLQAVQSSTYLHTYLLNSFHAYLLNLHTYLLTYLYAYLITRQCVNR